MIPLFPYQKDSVRQLCDGKYIIRADPGTGKSAVMVKWLEQRQAKKIIIATTASKVASGGFNEDIDKFASSTFRTQIDTLECVSWHMLYKWVKGKTAEELADYTFCADECQRSKAGVSSQMGKAFLMITRYCKEWAGFTATPGDTWIDYHSYFIASGKVKNKTAFKRKFCIEQRYPFPKILAYQHEDTLKRWWGDISYSPDTSVVMGQLPPLTHQVIKLPVPKGYKKVLKTSTTLEGEPLESNMDLLHYLRQMCATPDKLSALSDLLETLSSPLVIFYNYRCEREQILELVSKMKRKVWRIDGECHDIPTADTIGNTDIVLCHYLSGSEALNLQFCNYWLSYSYNYSYSTTRQAMGRIRRVGQAKPQFYYWLRCEKTIEDEVAKALSKKQDFVEELWENNY